MESLTMQKALEPASQHQKPIDYPKPDGVLTFDRLSSVFLSNTNHEERRARPSAAAGHASPAEIAPNIDIYAGPSTPLLSRQACMSGSAKMAGEPKFVINAQNCVHCKTCDIKDPNQNINWVPPQGGEGPVYANM